MIGNIEDWVIIAVVVGLLFLGPKKIPEIARSLGRARGEYEKAQNEMNNEIHSATKTPIKQENKNEINNNEKNE